jgi:hypothetical protein
MFKQGFISSVAAVGFLSMSASLSAAPITTSTVYDSGETQYIGADGGSHGDVVGLESKFDIYSMDITQDGSSFDFTVNTAFAGEAGIYPGLTNGNTGIGYGDLFLANEWAPIGADGSGYVNDDASNGTDWTWGLVLSDRFGNGGDVYLARLPGNNSETALLSDSFMDVQTSQYRNGQEVAVDMSDGAAEAGLVYAFGNVGTWGVGANQLNINVDLGQTDLLDGDTLAFHWGMTCANDVIEGEVELTKKVPEPGTIGLIALALAGMLFMRRRSNKA